MSVTLKYHIWPYFMQWRQFHIWLEKKLTLLEEKVILRFWKLFHMWVEVIVFVHDYYNFLDY